MFYIIKILISALLIVIISEISKKNVLISGLIASLPLISILSILWIFFETKDIQKISNFSYSIFLFVIPSLSFFITLPFFLKKNVSFFNSMALSSIICIVCYYILTKIKF